MPDLPLRVSAILKIAMPNIDANHKRYNKKIAKTQKAVSEFDKISMQKVKDVSILPMQDGDDWNYGDEEFLP